MDLGIQLGLGGALLLILGALSIAIAIQLVGEPAYGPAWLLVGLAAIVGGFVASEWIVGFRAFEPVWDGLAVLPAAAGALVVGVAADAVARWWTHGSYFGGVTA
jgi:hypothetical protein